MATDIMVSPCPESVCFALPVFASQSFIVLSKLPLATVWPSGEKATEVISPPCPLSACCSAPVAASHNLIVFLNPSTVANVCPFEEKITGGPVCARVRFNDPVCTSQSFTRLPSPPLASVFPSAEKATDLTLSSCPVNVCFNEPLNACSAIGFVDKAGSFFVQAREMPVRSRMKANRVFRWRVSDDEINM